MPLLIPTPENSYSQITVTLGGQSYSIIYTFNEVDERWRISLYTGQEEPIIEGLKVLENQFLLWRYNLEQFDHGDIACVQLAPNTTNPVSRDNLGIGKEYSLVYFTNEEL